MSDGALQRRPALDGLRGVAVLAVLAYHLAVPGAGGGFLGVDVFFVLSGFLIGSLLDGERSLTGRIDLLRFWARRARRLLPALVVVALVVAAWVHLQGDWETWGLRRDDLLATLGYVANWHFILADTDYFAATSGASPLLHTWSLAVEEQFYFLWPLLLLAAWRIGRGRRRLLVALVVALIAISTLAMALLFDPASPSRAYYGTDTRISQILVGVLLGLLLRPWRGLHVATGHARRDFALVQGVLGAILLAAFVVADPTSAAYYDGGALLVALVVGGLILAFERAPDAPVARLLSSRWPVYLGTISYGLYLWHWPVIVATAPADPTASTLDLLPLRIAASVGLAAVMYVLVERPIREGRIPVIRRRSVRTLAAAAVVLVLAANTSMAATDLGAGLAAADLGGDSASAGSGVVVGGDQSGNTPADGSGDTTGPFAPSPSMSPASGATPGRSSSPTATPIPTATPAPTPVPVALTQAEIVQAMNDFSHWQCPSDYQVCTKVWGRSGGVTVVTFGDSSIGSLDVGMTEWAQKTNHTFILAASGGCDAAGEPRSNDPSRVILGPMDQKCRSRYLTILGQVATLPGPLVVLVSDVSEHRSVVLSDGSVAPFGSPAHTKAVTNGLEYLVSRLNRPDVTIVLTGPAPHTLKPKCTAPAGSGECALSTVSADWAAQAAIAAIFQGVAARHPGRVVYIPMGDLVCPFGGPCTSWQGQTLIRWDGIHYTRPGSRLVVAGLMKRLKAAGVALG